MGIRINESDIGVVLEALSDSATGDTTSDDHDLLLHLGHNSSRKSKPGRYQIERGQEARMLDLDCAQREKDLRINAATVDQLVRSFNLTYFKMPVSVRVRVCSYSIATRRRMGFFKLQLRRALCVDCLSCSLLLLNSSPNSAPLHVISPCSLAPPHFLSIPGGSRVTTHISRRALSTPTCD